MPIARVRQLVRVGADISRIPPNKIPKVHGADGRLYWEIDFSIEVTCYSGYTTYELIHDNVNYGPVASEYV